MHPVRGRADGRPAARRLARQAVTKNNGLVDGGQGLDICRVQSGTPPMNCEL
ncbi:hypothetical protein ACFUJR_36250 [Streptomyces sp. NPDC057271]|uniref:hypothetical protein n=1 Tax=unclassified Streptomyces TaxID=2593676 RepID=UPI00363551D4